jgi:hypothetical protein
MLFSKPLQEITFEDITEFCTQWPEGVRVEYKGVRDKFNDVAAQIPKVVSSFANTQGGIWIIGVKTDSSNRAILPIKGFPREVGLEERITQTCYSNLYPALLPDIRILDVPDDTNNVVAVVIVPESLEAPHAIENTTRVYIRSNNTTERIALSEIDRIDYLLRRRRDAEIKGDTALAEMNRRNRILAPFFRYSIGPQYPYKPVFASAALFENVSSLTRFPRISKYCHPVRQGVMSPSRLVPGAPSDSMYFEANIYGQLTHQQAIEFLDINKRRYLVFEHLVNFLYNSVDLSRSLLGDSLLNLRVQARIDGISETGLICNDILTSSYCLDNSAEAETRMRSEQLANNDLSVELMVDLVSELLWSYHWGGDREGMKAEIRRVLPRKRTG